MMPNARANEPTIRSRGFDPFDHRSRSAMAIRQQRAAILAHCSEMTRRLGRPVSIDEAAREWIPLYAELWRTQFEKRWAPPPSHAAHVPNEIRPSEATPGHA